MEYGLQAGLARPPRRFEPKTTYPFDAGFLTPVLSVGQLPWLKMALFTNHRRLLSRQVAVNIEAVLLLELELLDLTDWKNSSNRLQHNINAIQTI
jgi:hypothetical protein